MDADSLLVGRYQMGRRIGAGGVGQVWSAHDTVLGREVAIKVQEIDPELDDAAFERFVREARSAAVLQHPNVVTIFDSGTDQDTAFLVMELLPGPTLTGHLAQHGPLPESDAVALAAQIASGLAAAHGAGVVHRDIKPANLMFDARGTLKIVDFGIARLMQTVTTQLTVLNGIIGSPPYLSPEGINGRPVDERSDIYSLGAVLMVMLTGRGPFEAAHPLALLQQHLHADPPRVRDRRPDISPGLDTLVAQMLSKSPQDRPQSAREVLDRLTGAPAAEAPKPNPSTEPVVPRKQAAGRPRQQSLLGARLLAGAGAMALVGAVIMVMVDRGEVPTAGSSEPSQLALRPTAAIGGGAEPSSPTPTRAKRSRPQPAPRPSTPSAAKTTELSPAAAKTRSATRSPRATAPAARSRPTTGSPPAPQTTDTGSSAPGLEPAPADLRVAVAMVSSNGEIAAEEADDLDRRVARLADQLERKRGAEATKKVDEFDEYVAGLASRERLAPEGEQRITRALSTVRELVANGR